MCLSQFVSFHPSQPFVSLLDFIGHAQSMVADCNHYGLKCFEFCLSKTSNLKGHWGIKKKKSFIEIQESFRYVPYTNWSPDKISFLAKEFTKVGLFHCF